MIRGLFAFLCMCLFTCSSINAEGEKKPVALIPYPVSLVESEGKFVFAQDMVIALEDKSLRVIAKDFVDLFERASGISLKVKVKSKKGDIVLLLDESVREEGYKLEVKKEKIIIKSAGVKGAFYALQTLRQLLPPAIEGEHKGELIEWSVPLVSVEDEPRFGYRGLMIDVARYFLSKEHLFRVIDTMGMLKLNKLHLHLTDDNGWRLEIKQYPLLTEVGSKRVAREGQAFPERRNARQGEPVEEFGYYSQEDIREIVAYAEARQIEVIPEIAMPRHSNAALAAYPLLVCPTVDKFIGVIPGLGGDHNGFVFCAGNDDVFTFLEKVLDEVMELFPSQYIHIGGDKLLKTHWEECPLCQERMKAEGLKTEADLYGYFMRRIDRYVRSKGRRLMGWEEVMDANLSKGAVVLDWHGFGHGAVRAGRQGHQFVMAPTGPMYLNRYQGPQWQEPVRAFEGGNTLKQIYQYEPIERYWTMSMRSLLLGVQASLWTEFCEKPEDIDFLLYPRLAAVSEAVWSFPIAKRWERFLDTLDDYEARWEMRGIVPSRSIYNVQHLVTPNYGTIKVELKCMHPDVDIRYTLDGREPDVYSDLCRRPLIIKETTTIRCATFKDEKQVGQTLVLPIVFNEITGKNLLRSNPVERRIVNGVRGSMKNTDGEWASWTQNDSVSLTFDVGSRKKINKVSVGCLNDFGQAIHKPGRIEVWLSDNDVLYWKMAEKRYQPKEIFREGSFVEDLSFEIDDNARYMRILLFGAGDCPEKHVRPGMKSKFYIDEIMME